MNDYILSCGKWSQDTQGERTGDIDCKNLAKDWHKCPYLDEIHDDQILCRCCDDCAGNCSDER